MTDPNPRDLVGKPSLSHQEILGLRSLLGRPISEIYCFGLDFHFTHTPVVWSAFLPSDLASDEIWIEITRSPNAHGWTSGSIRATPTDQHEQSGVNLNNMVSEAVDLGSVGQPITNHLRSAEIFGRVDLPEDDWSTVASIELFSEIRASGLYDSAILLHLDNGRFLGFDGRDDTNGIQIAWRVGEIRALRRHRVSRLRLDQRNKVHMSVAPSF